MYLFDLADYYDIRAIGNQYEEIPICDTRWSDMATTSRETSDWYFQVLSNWYNNSVTCLSDGDCKDAILAQWAQVLADRSAFMTARDNFWNMMGDECSTDGEFDVTIYDEFISIQQTVLCDVEELNYLVDGLVQ